MEFPKWLYLVILLLGICYLIRDIMYWRYWWSLNWWTAAFLLIGIGGLLSTTKPTAKTESRKK